MTGMTATASRLRRNPFTLAIGLLCLLVVAAVGALLSGAMKLPLQAVLAGSELSVEHAVLWHIRLPRILLAILVGGGLAYAGAVIQGLFRNPLAEPGLIGVANGSALAVGLYIVFFSGLLPGYWGLYSLNLFAFVGACIASVLVLKVVQRWAKGSVTALLLVGLAFNAIAASGIGLLTFLSDDEQLRTMAFWTMGSFGRSEWGNVVVTVTLMVPAIVWLSRFAMPLNLMQLGEREMEYTGMETARIKRNVILGTAVLVGSAVAAAGVIGFVGLLVPHLVRLFAGGNHRVVMPLSFLVGSVLMVLADTAARTVIAPAELPVGIVTSLLGGPFFMWLLLRQFGTKAVA